uniref:Carboxylic ester hydrolase n=1 Tax=Palpitomonas bilix TaxID=652834 RepID=A0A7S3G3L1_9EUKA|mmetsp:Transcript_16169/g.40906  ORF Transcript_16169/g.40906 Transcript_16169/m.40906 type:complete len:576 (+) Transcript_16169:139-1866(+)
MMCTRRICASLFAVLVVLQLIHAIEVEDGAATSTVTIDTGDVIGAIGTNGTRSFFSIPFAAPPTGAFRFRRPQPPAPWPTPRDCTDPKSKSHSACPSFDIVGGWVLGDEDCLYLNVYTPYPLPSTPLPVMFWIHGGGYAIGDEYDKGRFDGTQLAAERGVILVSANYRLNALGFLALPELQKEDEGNSTGNYGIMDQTFALQWVQRNIAAFGGDPSRVTIFGQSAGGFSVCVHVASPASKGLFSAAIMQSGSCDTTQFFRPLAKAVEFGYRMADMAKCNRSSLSEAGFVACLRSVPTSSLLIPVLDWFKGSEGVVKNFAEAGMPALPPLYPILSFGPTVDGSQDGLPLLPFEAILKGQFAKVPMIMGTVQDEGSIFVPFAPIIVKGTSFPLTSSSIVDLMAHFFNESTTEKVLQLYPISSFDCEDKRAARILRDYFFTCGARRAADIMSSAPNNVPVFLYQFTYPAHWVENWLFGDYHSSELPFLFEDPTFLRPFKEKDREMSQVLATAWTNMAKYHKPNAAGGADGASEFYWDQYNATAYPFADLTLPPSMQYNLDGSVCEFWDEVVSWEWNIR